MKRIFKFFILTVLATSTMFYSCESLELEDLASPNALAPDQADADLLFNSVQLSYRGAMGTFNQIGGELARSNQMFGRNYFNNYGPGSLNGPWNNLYSAMIPDIANMEILNTEDTDLRFIIGASKTMQADLMLLMVDYLGDIIFEQAFNAADFPSPIVDDDAAVYAAAMALLDEANGLLSATSTTGNALDMYYGGDISKWVKLNNTIKMRANLNMGNYAAVAGATNVISDSSDDFAFAYGTNELAPDTRHPDYAGDYRSDGANSYQSTWLMDIMCGDFGDLSSNDDPRRRYYFFRQNWRTPGDFSLFEDVNNLIGNGAGIIYISNGDGNGETLQCSLQDTPIHLQFTPDEDIWCSMRLGYWGRAHGNDEGTPPDNFLRTAFGVYPAAGSFDGVADAFPYVGAFPNLGQQVGLGNGGAGAGIRPIIMSSYVDFWRAEANLQLGNTGPAAVNLQAALTKSINTVMSFGALDPDANFDSAPTAERVAEFIADKVDEFNDADMSTGLDGFGFPVEKDKMDVLGEQYVIAIFGGASDGWNFVRRTGYPRTLQRSLEQVPGNFPRTLLYPSNETIANPNINQRDDNSTLVFWDSGVTNPAN